MGGVEKVGDKFGVWVVTGIWRDGFSELPARSRSALSVVYRLRSDQISEFGCPSNAGHRLTRDAVLSIAWGLLRWLGRSPKCRYSSKLARFLAHLARVWRRMLHRQLLGRRAMVRPSLLAPACGARLVSVSGPRNSLLDPRL